MVGLEMGSRGESPVGHLLALAILVTGGLLYAQGGDWYVVVGFGVVFVFVVTDMYASWYRGRGISRVARDEWVNWDEADE
jgi:uncharacterized protein (DUF58 family)